jgi:alanyl-tRNA synthetase
MCSANTPRRAGSLVAPDRLRFDFTHTRPLTPEQLHEIERRVNAWIRADTPVVWQELSYQAAIEAGAIALFGEKYGDVVRMVTIGCVNGHDAPSPAALAERELAGFPMCSRELCGGTHVGRSGEIGLFRIISESSVAAGVRRIEALTGPEAEAWVDAQIATLQAVAARVGAPQTQLVERVEALIAELKQRQRALDELTARMGAVQPGRVARQRAIGGRHSLPGSTGRSAQRRAIARNGRLAARQIGVGRGGAGDGFRRQSSDSGNGNARSGGETDPRLAIS